LAAISVISQGNVWDLCTVLDVDLNEWVCVWLCVDIYINKYCTYRYICRSINITILQNLLYLNCLYVNMDDPCFWLFTYKHSICHYIVCVWGGGGCVLICLKMQIESRCLIILWSSPWDSYSLRDSV
jgi:hypothetical protein